MKIRKGFVSNSSSTSFCVYGDIIEESELKDIFSKLVDTWSDEDDLYAICEDLELVFQDTGIEVIAGEDCLVIGRGYDTLRDNETGAEFKTSVETALKAKLGDEAVGKMHLSYNEGEIYS